MAVSVFGDKATKPTGQMLAKTLGKSNRLWQEINKHLKAEYGELTEEWKFYGQKSGWILKTLRKKRNLFFFIPLEGSFRVSFVFGDRAVAAAEQSGLPQGLITTLKNARIADNTQTRTIRPRKMMTGWGTLFPISSIFPRRPLLLLSASAAALALMMRPLPRPPDP